VINLNDPACQPIMDPLAVANVIAAHLYLFPDDELRARHSFAPFLMNYRPSCGV